MYGNIMYYSGIAKKRNCVVFIPKIASINIKYIAL